MGSLGCKLIHGPPFFGLKWYQEDPFGGHSLQKYKFILTLCKVSQFLVLKPTQISNKSIEPGKYC